MSRQSPAKGMILIKRLVTILEKGLTFLGQRILTVKARSTGRGQRPAHPVSHFQHTPHFIPQLPSQGTDPPDHFVAEDGGNRDHPVPPDGMQVTPTKCRTGNLHHGLSHAGARLLERPQAQGLARTLKDGRLGRHDNVKILNDIQFDSHIDPDATAPWKRDRMNTNSRDETELIRNPASGKSPP